jgi:hypothetical protein
MTLLQDVQHSKEFLARTVKAYRAKSKLSIVQFAARAAMSPMRVEMLEAKMLEIRLSHLFDSPKR